MKKELIDLFSQARDWGMTLISAQSPEPEERTLVVYRQIDTESVLVGRLSFEQGQFVFRYDTEYLGEPISAFPRKDQEYRSEHLWPFFSVRIPPFDRQDMREEIASRSLSRDQTIEILGSIARVSVSNPYEFKLS